MLDTYLTYKDESIIDYLKQYPAKMIDERATSQDTNMKTSTWTTHVRHAIFCA